MTKAKLPRVPASHPVQPIEFMSAEYHETRARDALAQCGTCNRLWDDGIATSMTPTPGGRCPFEYYHAEPVAKPARTAGEYFTDSMTYERPEPRHRLCVQFDAVTPTPSGRCPFEYFHPKEKNGTHYDARTPRAVVDVLERARETGQRVRLFYGDAETGKAWPEESDVCGTLGRSRGYGPHPMRVPLLLASKRSQGGDAVMDSSIVAIATGPNRFAYRHPQFDAGHWTVGKSDLPEYAAAVFHDGELHARCRTSLGAIRLAEFMRGQRMRP